MKIIHCGDIHLDSALTRHFSGEQIKERNREILQTFRRLIEYGAQNQVRAIIIAGDLFDTYSVLRSSRDVLLQEIESHSQIDFFYLKGNHDQEDSFRYLEALPKNLHLFNNEWTSFAIENEAGCQLTISGREMSARGTDEDDRLELFSDDINIVVLHGQVTDSRSSDKSLISLREYENKNIDYMALGHIHQHTIEDLDGRGVYCYCGCLEGRGFDETGDKGFVLLDIDMERRQIRPEFIPFAKRRVFDYRVDISEALLQTEAEKLVMKALDDMGARREDLVRITLTGQLDISENIDEGIIGQKLEDSYYLFKIGNECSHRIDYNDFINDPTLKGEFVKLVLYDSELSGKEKSEIIRMGFKALSDEPLE